jgi:hypothetical protein
MKRFPNRWALAATGVGAAVIGAFYVSGRIAITQEGVGPAACAAVSANVVLPFKYPFSVDGRLEEAGVAENSSSPYWWVNSGGYMDLKGGYGTTAHGDLPAGAKWLLRYAANNPVDTDLGLHPQNIFRMLGRQKFQDVAHEVWYRIDADQLSLSVSRNASNGLLQMTRYLDQNNLYYSGLRVDGQAVIKKKIGGRYYTMALKRVYAGQTYDRLLNPNLLPHDTWIGMRTITKNLDATRVSVKFYTDIGKTGAWTLMAEAIDDGASYGGAALTSAGYSGLRTDFMDVTFDDFAIKTIP